MVFKPVKFHWKWEVERSTYDIWDLIAGMETVSIPADFTLKSLPRVSWTGIEQLICGLVFAGQEVTQFPPEWVKGKTYRSRFVSSNGAIREFLQLVEIESVGGQSRILIQIEVVPGSFVGKLQIPLLVGRKLQKELSHLFKSVIPGKVVAEVRDVSGFHSLEQKRTCRRVAQDLRDKGVRPILIEMLVKYILKERDQSLRVMRPYLIARRWGVPLGSVLDLCIVAAKSGLLTFRWLVHCSACRTYTQELSTLSKLSGRTFCPICEEDFDVNVADNLELVFSPDPSVRELQEGLADEKSHVGEIVFHRNLDPGEVSEDALKLPPGRYRVRANQSVVEGAPTFIVGKRGVADLSIEIEPDKVLLYEEQSTEQNGIRITNRAPSEQVVSIESLSHEDMSVKGVAAFTSHCFRTYFPNEVLPPNESLPIPEMVVLFCDVAGSTDIYLRKGDVLAYKLFRDLYNFQVGIIDHHGGAIIKVMGDAVLALFHDAGQAMKAALAMRKELRTFNMTLDSQDQITLKMSLHSGTCTVVTINHHLDFFGAMINLGYGLQNLSKAGDIIVSPKVYDDPKVEKHLFHLNAPKEVFDFDVKGEEEPMKLLRIGVNPSKEEQRSSDEEEVPPSLEESQSPQMA